MGSLILPEVCMLLNNFIAYSQMISAKGYFYSQHHHPHSLIQKKTTKNNRSRISSKSKQSSIAFSDSVGGVTGISYMKN